MTLEITRGDTTPMQILVTNQGVVVDITGLDLWFTAKRRISDPDDDAIMRKNTNEGSITIPVGTDGIALVDLNYGDTQDLTRTTRLYYDVQSVDDAATLKTLVRGRMIVHADVTREAPGS